MYTIKKGSELNMRLCIKYFRKCHNMTCRASTTVSKYYIFQVQREAIPFDMFPRKRFY